MPIRSPAAFQNLTATASSRAGCAVRHQGRDRIFDPHEVAVGKDRALFGAEVLVWQPVNSACSTRLRRVTNIMEAPPHRSQVRHCKLWRRKISEHLASGDLPEEACNVEANGPLHSIPSTGCEPFEDVAYTQT